MNRGRFFYGWRIVFVLGATAIVSQGATNQLFGVLLLPIQRDLGWTRAQVSGFYSLGYVVWGVMAIAVGRLVDRHGPRALMATGAGLGAVCLAGMSTIHELWQGYLFWGIGVGVVLGLTTNEVAFTVVANWFYRRRGAALAALTAIAGLGSPVFLPIAGWVAAHAGWRATVLVTAALFAAVLPPCAIVLRRRPEDLGLLPDGATRRAAAPPSPLIGLGFSEAVRMVAFWTLTTSSVLANVSFGIVFVHQVAYLVGRGYDPVFAASTVGLMAFISIPGRILFNLASDRRHPQGLLAVALAAQASGAAILALVPSAGWLILYVMVYGIAFGAVGPLRAATIAAHFGRRSYGTIASATALPGYWAAGVGSFVAGWMFDVLGSYQLVLAAAVGISSLAVIAVLVTPRTAAPAAAG